MNSSLGHNVTDKLSVTFAEAAQANGMNASVGNNVSEIISVTFAEDTAQKTGFTQRTIWHDVQIATRIPDDVRELLRSTPVAERSPKPTPTPSAPLRQGLRQRAKTARMALSRRGMGYPTGNPEKAAWRGYGAAWRLLRRRPEVDARLTACTTKKAARQPGAWGRFAAGFYAIKQVSGCWVGCGERSFIYPGTLENKGILAEAVTANIIFQVVSRHGTKHLTR